MRSRWSVIVAILACGLIAGCEGGSGPELSPTSPKTYTGSIPAGGYELVQVDTGAVGSVISGLVGISGGTIGRPGHGLTVPTGAVSGLTLFAILPLRTGYVDVDLSALAIQLTGPPIDVGHLGFQNGQRVRLDLSYANATNVTDPADLVILRVFADGSADPLPTTLDSASATISTELDHFSRYAMAID